MHGAMHDNTMDILLTNDDGIAGGGLQKLAELLRTNGKHKVTVIAPEVNRSGVSHAVSLLNNPVKLRKVAEDTWTCSGNPSDCVIIALSEVFPKKPELVISGINQGENLGTDIIYSGTVAAARQASFEDIPSLAFSLAGNAPFCWDMAASWAVDHLEEMMKLWKKGTFVNVNIPNKAEGPQGILMAKPGIKHYHDKIEVVNDHDGGFWCLLGINNERKPHAPEMGTDIEAVSRNFVSVSSVCSYPQLSISEE